jgi:tetratricopeptide (TPR) repeat protein
MRGTVSYARKLDRTLQAGLQHHGAGDSADAEECYRQVLRKEPGHADALHLLGVLASQKGDYAESARLIRSAIQRNPKVSQYHGNLGNTFQLQGSLTEAIESYKKALSLEPGNQGFRHSLACALAQRGDLREAEEMFRQVLEAQPNFAEAHYNFGRLVSRAGKHQLAEACYRRAVALRPDCFEFHYNLGGTLFALGRYGEASESYLQTLRIRPNDPDARYSLGVALQKSGELQPAADAYRRALQLNPNHASALSNLGAIALNTGNAEQAVELAKHSIAIRPDAPDALCNLGAIQHDKGDFDGAAKLYESVLEQDANHVPALSNLGELLIEAGELGRAEEMLKRSLKLDPNSPNTLCNLGRLYCTRGDSLLSIEQFKKALLLEPTHAGTLCSLGFQMEILGDWAGSVQCYRIALQHHPDHAAARHWLGLSQLAEGNFAEGWMNCEARWQTPQFTPFKRQFSQPQWSGEDIRGARILVYSEQGLGDTLQFARYVPLLAARGATVYFEVQPGVQRVLQTLEGAERILVRGDALPEFEWQCPLMSLPLGFHTELGNIPANVPYLKASEAASCAWPERIPPNRVRVGLAWAGSPKHPRERHRSIPIEQLAQLARIEGATVYSLQKGSGAAHLEKLGPGSGIVNLDAEQKDFADTAAIVANLDLVITIDTSVAHLAGGMGKPVWILLHSYPDSRWLRGRDDSPWYPTARLFRQNVPGRWDDVVDRVRQELRDLVGKSQGAPCPVQWQNHTCASSGSHCESATMPKGLETADARSCN